MLGGTELIRHKLGKDAHAMTITPAAQFWGKEDGQDRFRRSLASIRTRLLLMISTSTGAMWTMRTCLSASAC